MYQMTHEERQMLTKELEEFFLNGTEFQTEVFHNGQRVGLVKPLKSSIILSVKGDKNSARLGLDRLNYIDVWLYGKRRGMNKYAITGSVAYFEKKLAEHTEGQ